MWNSCVVKNQMDLRKGEKYKQNISVTMPNILTILTGATPPQNENKMA